MTWDFIHDACPLMKMLETAYDAPWMWNCRYRPERQVERTTAMQALQAARSEQVRFRKAWDYELLFDVRRDIHA